MVGPQQGKSTSYTGLRLPESSSSFTLRLLGESQQLIENEWKFADLPWVCPQFALKFCHTYFYWIFHPQGVTFWHFFAVRAHIRIFLAFRICINFYPILEIELARPNLPPKSWGYSQGKRLSIFAIFVGQNLTLFTFCPFVTQKSHRLFYGPPDQLSFMKAWKTIDQVVKWAPMTP